MYINYKKQTAPALIFNFKIFIYSMNHTRVKLSNFLERIIAKLPIIQPYHY